MEYQWSNELGQNECNEHEADFRFATFWGNVFRKSYKVRFNKQMCAIL